MHVLSTESIENSDHYWTVRDSIISMFYFQMYLHMIAVGISLRWIQESEIFHSS